MSEHTVPLKNHALVKAFLKDHPYESTVLPAQIAAPSSALARLASKAKKAGKPLLQAGPFRYAKAIHRRFLTGDLRKHIAIPPAQRTVEEQTVFSNPVTFSIVVPLYNTPLPFLKDMLDSVTAQTYPHWELCLADGSDEAHGDVEACCSAYAAKDPRILYKKLERNEGISQNTNACIAMSSGQFISLFDHDDVLHPSALFETMKAIEEQQADVIYTDEATFVRHRFGTLLTYHYKPDFAKDNLWANNYICHFTSFSRELLQQAGLFRPAFDGSQDHDMILRLTEQAKNVVHVRKLLYFWRSHKASVASDIRSKLYALDAGQRAVQDSIHRVTGLDCTVENCPVFPAVYNVRYALASCPTVSVLVSSEGDTDMLKRCVASLLRHTAYEALELIVSHSTPTSRPFEALCERLAALPNCRVLHSDTASSQAARINLAAEHASGDYLVLLSDAVETVTPDWIEQLLMLAQRKDIGAVGAKLLHRNGTVHHAGYVLGLGPSRTLGAVHHGAAYQDLGHRGQLRFTHNVTAADASCLMLRRDDFLSVGGMDETLASPYDGADLCLKLRHQGLKNVFTPHAEAVLHAACSVSKADKDADRFRSRWQAVIEAGDPYFHPCFSLDHYAVWLQ